MQILQWLFKLKQEGEARETSTTNKNTVVEVKEVESKDLVVRPRSKRLKGDAGKKDVYLLRILLCRGNARECFYSTLDLKSLGSFHKRRHCMHRVRAKGKEGVHIMGHKADSSPAQVGNKVLPVCDASLSMPSISDEQCGSSEKKEKQKSDHKTKTISKMKELLRWAAAAKSEKGGKYIGRKVLHLRNRSTGKTPSQDDDSSSTPKISFRWETLSCSTSSSAYSALSLTTPSRNNDRKGAKRLSNDLGDEFMASDTHCTPERKTVGDTEDHCSSRAGNWITTDSECVFDGNRIIRRRVLSTIQNLKVPKRGFSNEANAGVPNSSHTIQVNAEQNKSGLANELDQYDIAIVGGGMVGMAFACARLSMRLTKHLNVAIIDSNPALGRRDGIKKDEPPDPRVSTITPATISFFKDVGAWQYVLQNRHAFFDKMQVWDYAGLGYTKYTARDVGRDILGLTSMDIQSHNPTKEVDSSRGCSAKLELSDGNAIYAKLVVGADGAKSHVRDLAGLKTTGWSYGQNAVICTVEHAVENQCAWQRFLPSGPIALLPMGHKFSNIVWTMSPKGSSEHTSMSGNDFAKAVNHALDFGDGPHPLLSVLGYDSGESSWELSLLKKFVAERKPANIMMTAILDGFQKAYSIDRGP